MAASPSDAVEPPRRLGLGRAIAGAVLLGLGLGGFFDGIVLHQLLQWHHMGTSAGFPPDSVENLKLNTLWDGLFHAATWVMSLAGLFLLWSAARTRHARWSAALLPGGLLLGWGLFNTVEGLVDHHLLGLHHVNETAPPERWLAWDLGFLAWGLAMMAGGWVLVKRARHRVAEVVDQRPAGAGAAAPSLPVRRAREPGDDWPGGGGGTGVGSESERADRVAGEAGGPHLLLDRVREPDAGVPPVGVGVLHVPARRAADHGSTGTPGAPGAARDGAARGWERGRYGGGAPWSR